MSEQSVIVEFRYGSRDLGPLFELEDKLESAITAANVGEYDGNEIAVDGSDGSLFMYGPDASRLAAVVRPILETAPFMRGAHMRLRYGAPDEPGAREEIVELGAAR